MQARTCLPDNCEYSHVYEIWKSTAIRLGAVSSLVKESAGLKSVVEESKSSHRCL